MCVYFDQIYWEWRDERQPATGRFRHGHCTKQDQSRCVILRLQTCQIQDSSWKEWHVPNFGIGSESASKHEGEGRERRGDLAQKLQRSHSSNFRHAARFRPRTRKKNCTKSSSATAKKTLLKQTKTWRQTKRSYRRCKRRWNLPSLGMVLTKGQLFGSRQRLVRVVARKLCKKCRFAMARLVYELDHSL